MKDKSNIELLQAPQSEMPRVQANADILFLPLSWDTDSPDIVATATPAKMSSYLLAAKPILIHAPPYAYICEYTRQEQVAEVVDEESSEVLSDAILRLLQDVDYSRRLIDSARALFYRNHDARKVFADLAALLNLDSDSK